MEQQPLRVIQPDERKANTIKSFLNKPAHELTIADTFLMQAGNSLIAIAVPTLVASLRIIFSRRRASQETHGL